MNTLVTVGTMAAYLYSVGVTVAPQFFRAEGIHVAVYFRYRRRPHHPHRARALAGG
jgi:cation transport ATPase